MSASTRRRRAGGNVWFVAALVVLACISGIGTGMVLMRLGRLPELPFLPPSATPSPTLPPTLTPSPTPPPSPTPTPTPVPPARVEAGDAALFAGDWPRAAAEYQAVLAQSDAAALRAAATLGLAKARLAAGDAAGAIETLTAYLDAEPETPHAADAHFLLGEAYTASSEWAAAMDAYAAYLALRPGAIDSYVHAAIANAAINLGDYPAAAEALTAALAAPRYDEGFELREQLGDVYAAQGDVDAAVAEYDTVYRTTVQNWRKAYMEVKAGQLLYQNGRPEEAYERFLHTVNNYPEAASAFDALLVLVNDGVPVDDLQRGLTNFHAANYEPALAAFQRYRDAYAEGDPNTSAPGDSTALYFIGRTYAALNQTAQAIAAWRELLETYPTDIYWTQAYFQIAFIQPYPDDTETFLDFVEAAPDAPEAPDALYRAARLHERNDDFAEAARLWLRIAQEYPDSPQAADAAMQAGLVLYRAGDLTTAARRFELATTLGTDTSEHARAWLWIGKVKEQQGDRAGARAAYQRAAGYGPHGYYPLRAAQLMRGEAPFAPPPGFDFDYDAEAERAQVDAWLRATFPQAANVAQPSALQPGVWQEARFVRGAELWRLGRLQQAHAEFNSLRLALAGDPLATWQLAVYFHEIGAYDLSIRAARQVVDLAGIPDTLLVPRYILRLRYPAPFAGYVTSAAQDYGLHPFLMYAKMRIESFFWKYALSVADARGLNQFIPATADDVAARMGLAGFTYDDLYRPSVSIPMGAFYLNFIADYTGGEPQALLAGYYAGPGNAEIWLEMAEGDPDLFVEVIRLPDAKGYVQTTFEFFEEYRELYGTN